MAVLIGGSDSHYIADRFGTHKPRCRLQVQTLTGGPVTPSEPADWDGDAFPDGYALTDDDGFYRFNVPDSTGAVRVRPLTDAGTPLGDWRIPTGQVIPNGPLQALLSGVGAGAVSYDVDPDGVPVLVIGDTSDVYLDTDPDGTTVLVIPGV